MGLDMVPDDPQIDPQMTLRLTLQTQSPDGPQIALRSQISRPQISHGPERALFQVLLTIADIKDTMSKDWIAPPTCCQEYLNGY